MTPTTAEAFFDDLYAQFCVTFPVFAVTRPGAGLAAERSADGSASLVILTDRDLADRYLAGCQVGSRVKRVGTAERLDRLLDRLPAGMTHVTFDPTPAFHRRFPLAAVRGRLP